MALSHAAQRSDHYRMDAGSDMVAAGLMERLSFYRRGDPTKTVSDDDFTAFSGVTDLRRRQTAGIPVGIGGKGIVTPAATVRLVRR